MADDEGVIIDLSNGSNRVEYNAGIRQIKVTSNNEPRGSDFIKYTHEDKHNTDEEKKPFHLAKVQDDRRNPIDISKLGGQNAISVSAYCWRNENGRPSETPEKVLLVGVTISDTENKTKYYAKSKEGGNRWAEHDQLSNNGDNIEKELDDLVCQHYKAVTINLTKSNSKKYAEKDANSGENKYCCNYHAENSDKKVSVTSEKVSCTQHSNNPTHIPYFKHSISGGNLATIKYHDGGTRKNITLNVPNLSNLWCKSVSAFYCSGDAPALIYVDLFVDSSSGWYRKQGTNDDEQWIMVPSIDKNIKPETINNCSHEDFKKLVKALREATGCPDLQECPPDPAPGQAAAQSQVPSTGTSPNLTRDISIFGGLATVVSGLACFAGFKYYRSHKGDPWVRQI